MRRPKWLDAHKHHVYRYYNSNNELLYVGVTYDLQKRIRGHKSTQPWFDEIDRQEYETFSNRDDAIFEEARLIQVLNPLHNKQRPILVRDNQFSSEVIRKQELVKMAVEHFGSQKGLIDAMNSIERFDGRVTHATDVTRWLHEDRIVSGFDAVWIQIATRGAVRYEWFHKGFREAVASANRFPEKRAARKAA